MTHEQLTPDENGGCATIGADDNGLIVWTNKMDEGY